MRDFLLTYSWVLAIGALVLAFSGTVLYGFGWRPRPLRVVASWLRLLRLRKLALPALLMAGLPVAYLVLAPTLPTLTAWFYHAVPSDALAATGAEAAAGQQASGFVPFAIIGSKLLAAVVAYVLMSWLPFRVQGLTHPGPTTWAKKDYTADFEALAVGSKFEVYTRLQQGQAIRAAAALVFGCLVV